MARNCIFCGEEIGAFSAKKLTCGDYSISVCGDCFGKYSTLSSVELAQKILATGRSKHADYYRDFLNDKQNMEQQKLEREKKEQEEFNRKHPESGKCPKCGGTMREYGPVSIKLGEETFFFSDWNRFFSGSMTVIMGRCNKCTYTEFFTPNDHELTK